MTEAEAREPSIFAQPRRLTGEANRALTAWQTTVCSLLQENWRTLMDNELSVQLGRNDSATALQAVGQLDDPGYAARFEIGPDALPSMACFSSRMVLALVNDMLGTPSEEWPEVRDLTPIETSMAELLFGEVGRAISQGWPAVEPLACELVSVVSRPMRSRVFPPDEVLSRTRVNLQTRLGEEPMVWLIPRKALESVGITDTQEEGPATPAPQLRTLAEGLPIQLTVRLGDTTMKLSELDQLRAGDYLTLDQRVVQPLEVTVDSQLQWLGHACRLGTRQGFEIIGSKKD